MAEYSYDIDRGASIDIDRADTAVRTFMVRVYGWMCAGLLLTAVIAQGVASSASLTRTIFGNPGLFYGLLILEVVLVLGISSLVNRVSPLVAGAVFFVYAALNGVTLSALFLIYTQGSLSSTFFITAGTFGAMSIYGTVTKRDLTTVGSYLVMAVWGLIIASIVNIFFRSPALYWISTYAGVAIFVGLTAYDTQAIRSIAVAHAADSDSGRKAAIMGALRLYLDFVNLFIYLLRLFGKRR